MHVLDVHPEHFSQDFEGEPSIHEPCHRQFLGTFEQARTLGKRAVQILGDIPAFRKLGSAVLEHRDGLEPAAEHFGYFRETQRNRLVAKTLVRQCIADAPHERAGRAAVFECEFVEAKFQICR